jgi:putative salt-induced outer membrane protein YdiY
MSTATIASYADEETAAKEKKLKYEYAFTEKNKFSQSLEYLQGFDDKDNYLINSETALIAALNSYLALKLSYIVNYNNQPSSDTPDDTDTALLASIVVNY